MTKTTLTRTLKTYFGYDCFRKNQEQIINNVLAGNDTMVIMPTGGGKSMCYQLPALLLEGMTLVISPLIALMKDQVDALQQNGIAANFLHSQQSVEDKLQLKEQLSNNALKLLYIAPESLNILFDWVKKDHISLVAIDEAHCISSWGHDFRPAYTQLAHLKSLVNCPLIALTATADNTTRQDMLTQLNMQHADVFLSSFNRKNLSLTVASGQKRLAKIEQFIQKRPNEAGIIYCLSRKSTENLAEKLLKKGFNATAYHAGLAPEARELAQNAFIQDDVTIICATIAFGMGIDKSNVRWVIHYNLPKNIEGYYQEIGRAGRDGVEADTLLFYSYADVQQLRKFAESDNASFQALQFAKLNRIQQYAEALTCRRKVLLSYFGEHLATDCGNCDNCMHPPESFDGTILAQKALSAVVRLNQQEPMNVVIDLLRGGQNAYMLQQGYHLLKTHGVGQDVSWQDWQQYLIQLINQGFINIQYNQNNILTISEAAKTVLLNNQRVKLAKIIDVKERLAKSAKTSSQNTAEITDYPIDLFEQLRQRRKEIAEENAVPAYVVFSDACLRHMASEQPQTEAAFLSISGVGDVKLARYGEEFMTLIRDYVAS